MHPAIIIICAIFLALSIAFFVISFFQFREKGFLFNNAYIWASKEERKRMSKEEKRSYYRQSAITFLLGGISLLALSAYAVTEWIWLAFVLILAAISALIYAVVSSQKMERHK